MPNAGGAAHTGSENTAGHEGGNTDHNSKEKTPGKMAKEYGVKLGFGTLAAGGVLATIYGIIMLIPRAVGSALFPFLPSEYQPIMSCCSSCSSSGSVFLLLLLVVASRFM